MDAGTGAGAQAGALPGGDPSAGRHRVLADARRRGLALEFVRRPPAHSLPEAAALLGIGPGDIVKSLVLKHQDGSFLFALVPGDRQVSWPKLRALLGVNKISMPSADVAFRATGYARGTITPLGSSTAWPVYADRRMSGKRVSMGAGEHGYSLFVAADELIRALGATVADISDPA